MTSPTEVRKTTNLDIHSPEYRQRTVQAEAEIRSESPVAWTTHNGGHWVVTSHHGVGAGLRDRDRYSTGKYFDSNGKLTGGVTIPTAESYRALPNESDPPKWDHYRKLVSRPFAPQAVEALRPLIERYTTEVIDHMVELGEADFVMQVGSPVTALITLDVLGLPISDWRFYAERIHQTFTGMPGDDNSEAGIPGIHARLSETIAQRRLTPQKGLIDDLIASEIEGEPLSDEIVKDLLYNILIGGFDTTAGLLAGALKYLAGKPDVQRRLIEDDSFMRTATEEFLRWVSPAVGLAKTAAQDMELEGQTIETGDRIWFMYRAANWDPEEFEDPETPDLERSPNRHYAFGSGIHRCLGSNLARAVFQAVLRQFLQRVPDYEVQEDELENYAFAATNAGYSYFPIRYTPGKRLSAEPIFDKL